MQGNSGNNCLRTEEIKGVNIFWFKDKDSCDWIIRAVGIMLMLSLFLALVVALGMPGRNKKAEQPVTVMLWHYYNGDSKNSLESAIEEFNEGRGRELGIEIVSSGKGTLWDMENEINASVGNRPGSSGLPNIIMGYNELASKLAEGGMLLNLAPYFSEEELDGYVYSYLAEGMLSGNREYIKLFPVAKSTELLYLNATDWKRFSEETGADISALSTMEGVAEIAELYYNWTDAQTEAPWDGKAFFGRDDISNFIYISGKQLGVDVVSAGNENRVVVNFPESLARRLWDVYYVPYIKGYFSAEALYHSDDIKTGKVLCYVGSSAGAGYFPGKVILGDKESYEIERLSLPAPKLSGGMDYAIQQGPGMSVIRSNDEEMEAAVEFLRWLSQGEQNIHFAVNAGYMPVSGSMRTAEEISEKVPELELSDAMIAAMKTAEENELYTTPPTKGGQQLRDNIGVYLFAKAEADRRLVVARLYEGYSLEDAVSELASEESFRLWYDETLRKIDNLTRSIK